MKQPLFTFICVALLGLKANAQNTELYVFKDERKEHLKAAKKARAIAREKAVANDFFMRVRTQTSQSTAKMEIAMKKAHDAEIRVADMDGNELAVVYKGELNVGQHEFYYEPKENIAKPLVCQLLIDGKTEAMKVVKFNYF